MISQTSEDPGRNAEARTLASAANHASHDAPEVPDGALARLSLAAAKPASSTRRRADEQALEAHVERRRRLAVQIRVENPSRTEEEIEERLAQFGV
jgi:hypothetical protein